MGRHKLFGISEPLRGKIIELTESELPERWQADIPGENLAVDGAGRHYAFSIDDIGLEGYHNIKYYVNRPINEEYFLTIMAYTKDNNSCVEVILCEGSEIDGFTGSDRVPVLHHIESELLIR